MYFLYLIEQHSQVFVTYLTGALYVHPLWFYKHQHDNRVRSKLFVACQRWWFQWRFAAILVNCAPSGEMHNYCTPHIIKENYENFLIHRCNCILLSQEYGVWQVVKTPTIIFNNPVVIWFTFHSVMVYCSCRLASLYVLVSLQSSSLRTEIHLVTIDAVFMVDDVSVMEFWCGGDLGAGGWSLSNSII